MDRHLIRKVDRLVLGEFIPFFIMGVAAFILLMAAITLGRQMVKYIADYHLTLTQVSYIFMLSLPQTIAYTIPIATLFAGMLAFGRLSDTSQITALRAGGLGFFRIVLPALVFAWFIVLGTFILNEKIAPKSTVAANEYLMNALMEKGFRQEQTDISYMEEDAGWLFAAASVEGNVFYNVKWWDFARPGEHVLYIAEEGVWEQGEWQFNNVEVLYLSTGEDNDAVDEVINGNGDISGLAGSGYLVRSMTSPSLVMEIDRMPSDILSEGHRDPEEMSLQELQVYIHSEEVAERGETFRNKVLGTYHLKIAVPFASIIFVLLAAPLVLAPQRSSSSRGVGLVMLLVFAYYMLTTFAVKIAESGTLPPVMAAWFPNLIFLIAGIILIGRFYVRSA